MKKIVLSLLIPLTFAATTSVASAAPTISIPIGPEFALLRALIGVPVVSKPQRKAAPPRQSEPRRVARYQPGRDNFIVRDGRDINRSRSDVRGRDSDRDGVVDRRDQRPGNPRRY